MLATPNTLTANTRSQSSGVDVDDVADGADAGVVAQHVDAAVLGDDAVGRGVGAVVGSRHVEAVERGRGPTTVSPAAVKRSTMAEPMPPLDPVTTTTRSAIVPASVVHASRRSSWRTRRLLSAPP